MDDYDFGGYATKNDLVCDDGLVMKKDAFKHNDGAEVPLLWNHDHNDPSSCIGKAYLENRADGVYAYCKCNDTPTGKLVNTLVHSGDIKALSIWANKVKKDKSTGNVFHGDIKEVSVCYGGCNPGAFIDTVITHGVFTDDNGEYIEEECTFCSGCDIELAHSADSTEEPKSEKSEEKKEEVPEKKEEPKTEEVPEKKEEPKTEENKEIKHMAEEAKNEKTVQDVLDSMTEEQRNVVYYLVGKAAEGADENTKNNDNDEGDSEDMKHNAFDNDYNAENNDDTVISHAMIEEVMNEAKSNHNNVRDTFIAHGITNIEYLFPDNKAVSNTPYMINNETTWVTKVLNGVHHTPFSRIKSTDIDVTADEARAKGYTKGKKKIEEVIVALKRTTDPTTIYKKQAIDRDDKIDITDFDVVAWIKSEMRLKLDEELARAIVIGDGRTALAEDKIKEDHIRPIISDDDLYTIKVEVDAATATTAEDQAREFIKSVIKARKDYRGSGMPTLFTTEDLLTECLLLTDKVGRDLYEDENKLAKKLRVKEIVTIPNMESHVREGEGFNYTAMGVIVNLADYNVGADKGGAVSMFDDFDIDYNKEKYLIETRCSGALVKPKAAIAVELKTANA